MSTENDTTTTVDHVDTTANEAPRTKSELFAQLEAEDEAERSGKPADKAADKPAAPPVAPKADAHGDDAGKTGEEGKEGDKAPWRQPQVVPLATHIEERRKLQARIAELEGRAPASQGGQPPAATPTFDPRVAPPGDPLQPVEFAKTIDDFNGDPVAWLEAARKHDFAEARRIATAEYQQREQQTHAAAQEQRIASDFDARTDEASKANPEVKQAVEWFKAHPATAQLPAELRYAIVHDPDGPAKIHHLLSNPDEAAKVFNVPGFAGALAFAHIQIPRAAAPAAPTPSVPPRTPPSLPRAPKGSPASSSSLEDLDGEDFERALHKRMRKR